MGACLSSASKVSGASSSNAGNRDPPPKPSSAAAAPQKQRERGQQHPSHHHRKRPSGVVPCGKRTDFGYAKDFENRYLIGKLLGHGQFGYTFVATDRANGETVAVKRIDKNKLQENGDSPVKDACK